MENQQDISEPLWRAGLSIAKFCNDADKAVHKMSERHPEYSEHLTDEKVELIKSFLTGPTRKLELAPFGNNE